MEAYSPLPTVDEIADWLRVPAQAVAMAERLVEPACRVKAALADCYTAYPISVHLDEQQTNEFRLSCPAIQGAEDARRVKRAMLDRGFTCQAENPAIVFDDQHPSWIKVGHSPMLRAAGTYLNFFPGKYPGGIPNKPGPVMSMLTSGLVGAGLGYGVGWAGEQLMPERWRRGKLRNTLAVLGGAAGVAPGAIWGMTNKHNGLPFNDSSALAGQPGDLPQLDVSPLGSQFKQVAGAYVYDDLDDPETLKTAGDTLGDASAMSVNIDTLGRTLWESGTSPAVAGTTMAVMQAARQMPGGNDDSGWVTPAQVGHLAANMGAGYASGALVGAALGTLTGMPDDTQDALKRTGLYAGFVRALVPHLFGYGGD